MHGKHAHCSWCGTRFAQATWPRTCSRCQHQTFLNPLPVAVLVQPVDDGVLLIRRGESGRGHRELALPGGFIERGESWQHACARELFEEANLKIAPESIEPFRVSSTSDGFLIVVGRAPGLRESDLPPFAPTDEALERVIVRAPRPLAFSMHEEVLRDVLPTLAKPVEKVLELDVDHLHLRLNAPTHRVATEVQPLPFTQVEPSPRIVSGREFASLHFTASHGSASLAVQVRRLRGIGTLEQALAFFALETGVQLTPTNLVTREVPAGLVASIDLAEAGWAPGNTFTFVICPADKPRQTLYFSPTHWLEFDWSSLTVT